MSIRLEVQQDGWRKPLLSDQKGLRDQHDRGRLQGGFLNGVFQVPGAPAPTNRADGIGEVELLIDGERWVEIDGEWVKEKPH